MNKEINDIDITELIGKYLACETTKKEVSLLENWVLESTENKNIFNNYKQVWLLTQQQTEDIDVNFEWNNISSRLFTKEKINKTNNLFLKIAAAVIVLIVSSYSVLYLSADRYETLIADNSIVETTLADGSLITLNHNSKLEINNSFNEKKRKVKLSGNAFFNVHKDKNKPFVIECNSVEVEVLGTSFYIKSDGNTSEVIVESGTVSVKMRNDDSKIIIITENEKCVYKGNELSKLENDDQNFMAWKTKVLSFNNQELYKVIDKINETYHTKIRINSPEIQMCKITATFDNKPIEAVLNILKATLDLKVEEKKSEIIITGKPCE